MLLRLVGKCQPLALQLNKMAAPVCAQRSYAAITWRSYRIQSPATVAVPSLQRPSPPLIRGFHTSSSLHKRRDKQDDEFGEMLRDYRQKLKKTPRPAVYLSLAALAPVAVAPLTMSIGGHYYPEMAFLQIAAANCMLSFYGGMRWGISAPENSPLRGDTLNLLLGTLLPFVAWFSLVISDDFSVSAVTWMSGMLLGVFGGVGMLPPFPFWLSFLRAVSFLATFCFILITLWFSVALPEKSLKNQSPK